MSGGFLVDGTSWRLVQKRQEDVARMGVGKGTKKRSKVRLFTPGKKVGQGVWVIAGR